MLSRKDALRQALVGMEPEREGGKPVTFSGSVAQVNVISHATFNIGSIKVLQPEQDFDHGEGVGELVHTLAVLESVSTNKEVTPEEVRRRIKTLMGLPADGLIPLEKQQDALDLLVSHLTIARGGLRRDPEIARRRSGCYVRCLGIARQYALHGDMRQHMTIQWGAESMRDLGDEELWSLERYMRIKERSQRTQEG